MRERGRKAREVGAEVRMMAGFILLA